MTHDNPPPRQCRYSWKYPDAFYASGPTTKRYDSAEDVRSDLNLADDVEIYEYDEELPSLLTSAEQMSYFRDL